MKSIGLACVLGASVAYGLTQNAGADAGCNTTVDLPLFDAHMHYKEPAWDLYPVETVLSLMDRSGVAMALVSSTPDEGTIALFEYAPERIVPELRPYHGEFGSSNWTKASAMLDYLRERMVRYPHRGIGEFHIHQLDETDKPFLRQVAALALEHDALVHIHSGAEAVRLFYELEPRLTVIWAHAGMSEPPAVIGPMLAAYPSLYVDTSYREHDILSEDGIEPEWRDLILKFSDRFMVGTDTWSNSQWASYEELVALNRRWLSCLPAEAATAIAFGNAERLLGVRVSEDLLEKR